MVNARLYDNRSFASPAERREFLLKERDALIPSGGRGPRLTSERMEQLGARLCDRAVEQQRERTDKLLARIEQDITAKRKVLDKDTMSKSADRLSTQGARKHWMLQPPPPLKKRPLSGERLDDVVRTVYEEPIRKHRAIQDELTAKYNPPKGTHMISKERAGAVASRLWGHQKEMADRKRDNAYKCVDDYSPKPVKLSSQAMQDCGSRLAVPSERWTRK